jgi:hypothetical protein
MTIKSTITQFIGCLSKGKLTISTRLTSGSLLVDPRTGTKNSEANRYHEYYRDPVGGIPREDNTC